jgi:hypothetical protein
MSNPSNNNTTPPTNIITMVFRLPPYGVDSMNRPNLMRGRPSEGVGRGLLCGVLQKSIKYQRYKLNSTANLVFDELLARRQKWWPKRHPSLTTGTQTIRIDE